MSDLTHRDLTRAAARWLLGHGSIHAATYELAVDGGQADAIGVSCPDPAAAAQLRAGEYAAAAAWRMARMVKRAAKHAAKYGRSFDDSEVPGHTPETIRAFRDRALRRLDGPGHILIAECKRTRSDLLADLRAGKLRRYEGAASECWLVATADVVRADAVNVSRWQKDRDAAVAQLVADGLPDAWGIAIVGGTWPDGVRRVVPIREARRLREPAPWEVQAWADRMLQSMCHRVVAARGSPMSHEAADEGTSEVCGRCRHFGGLPGDYACEGGERAREWFAAFMDRETGVLNCAAEGCPGFAASPPAFTSVPP